MECEVVVRCPRGFWALSGGGPGLCVPVGEQVDEACSLGRL